jgi:hypothetical protein
MEGNSNKTWNHISKREHIFRVKIKLGKHFFCPGFYPWQGQSSFFVFTESKPALGSPSLSSKSYKQFFHGRRGGGGVKWSDQKLTTHFHLVPKLGTYGAISSLSHAICF